MGAKANLYGVEKQLSIKVTYCYDSSKKLWKTGRIKNNKRYAEHVLLSLEWSPRNPFALTLALMKRMPSCHTFSKKHLLISLF